MADSPKWHIRLDMSDGGDPTVHITGRVEYRDELAEFIRYVELAKDMLASAIEAQSDATGTGAAGGESAPEGDARNPSGKPV